MARKQMQIPGTERKEIPDVENAAEAYREVRDTRAELSKREAVKKLELLAVMRANKVKKYRYHDENGEEIEALIDDEPTVKLRKTGEAESEIGEGVDEGRMSNGHAEGSVPQGLIDQAMKAQADAGVAETADGDVIPLESAKKRKKSGGRKKS